jgi:maltooligosyltrehalose synthase
MVTLPNRQTPIDEADLTTLKTDLTTPIHPTQRICSQVSIQTRLDNPQLTLVSLRNLFGHIRKAFIDVLWQQKQLERWKFRCTHLGSEYAQAQSGGSLSIDGRISDRHAFARWMDEELEIRSGEKQELVTMVIRHVRLFRESELRVRELKEEKERVLDGEGA